MKFIKNLVLVFLALFLVILDTTFFSALPIYEATVISSFVATIIIALIAKFPEGLFFSSTCVIAMSVFSSVSVFVLAIVYFVIPSIIYFLKTYYFKELIPIFTIPFFLGSFCLFNLVLMISIKEFSEKAFLALAYFALINTFVGLIVYSITKLIKKKFFYVEELKI